jgi:hypothetical protein
MHPVIIANFLQAAMISADAAHQANDEATTLREAVLTSG